LSLQGGSHHRLHEELTVSGGYLRDQGFKREERVTQIDKWLSESSPVEPNEGLFDAMKTRFERSYDAILQTVEARSKDRLKHLINTLNGQKQKEIENIRIVLDELEKAILIELNKEDPEQFELFSEDERLQLRRDNDALRARLARIPSEREDEIHAIEKRYDGFAERTFPVAVVFLVPASLMNGGAV